jgi:hypothetical protein
VMIVPFRRDSAGRVRRILFSGVAPHRSAELLGLSEHLHPLGQSGLSCMSLGRAPFGYTANADTVLIARKERNACTNERVADGRKNSIPRLDSPFQVIGKG